MSKPVVGGSCGLVFGLVVCLSMLPMQFEDKRAALLGAFTNRFAVGVVIGTSNLPVRSWRKGMLLGSLLSLPEAIITKAWGPIMSLGVLGGGIIGWVVDRWGR